MKILRYFSALFKSC